MSEAEKDNSVCPACGYPSHAGHAADCSLGGQVEEEVGKLDTSVDLRTAYGGKFIFAHPAEGENAHELKAGDFKMPVSFAVEAGRFRINGVQNETNNGGIISGIIADDVVEITHIKLAEELRGSGIGRSLLVDLEDQFRKQGVKIAYAAFANKATVEFFIKNEYKVVPIESLTAEENKRLAIDISDFDRRVASEEDFNRLKGVGGNEFRKILMTKKV